MKPALIMIASPTHRWPGHARDDRVVYSYEPGTPRSSGACFEGFRGISAGIWPGPIHVQPRWHPSGHSCKGPFWWKVCKFNELTSFESQMFVTMCRYYLRIGVDMNFAWWSEKSCQTMTEGTWAPWLCLWFRALRGGDASALLCFVSDGDTDIETCRVKLGWIWKNMWRKCAWVPPGHLKCQMQPVPPC